ncbi:MAG: chorismate-binding protein, partial [Phycisphaerae bacterium]
PHIEIEESGVTKRVTGNPLQELRSLVQARRDAPSVGTFSGGAVGYLGYEMVHRFERLPLSNPDPLGHPDSYFLFPEEIIVLDHRDGVAHIILYDSTGGRQRTDEIKAALSDCAQGPKEERDEGEERHEAEGDQGGSPKEARRHEGESAIRNPQSAIRNSQSPIPNRQSSIVNRQSPQRSDPLSGMTPNMSPAQFRRSVERAKEYIYAGDIFQVVLSQRFAFAVNSPPLDLYGSLRRTNPSPYMYFLQLDGLHVLGSSPEVLVKLTGNRAITKPLAGTRPRGRTPHEDRALAAELRADPKELAEHVMLVDLARNDIGRVCQFGSVKVTESLEIERFKRVMHLVSNVEGTLRADCDAFDLVTGAFPAGTVSGAPKIRAMEIIDELEPAARGIYAGAIGYFSATGDMDLCIAIRTIVVHGKQGYIQAGAGIVGDSEPEREYQETLNKASALMRAVELSRQHDGIDD